MVDSRERMLDSVITNVTKVGRRDRMQNLYFNLSDFLLPPRELRVPMPGIRKRTRVSFFPMRPTIRRPQSHTVTRSDVAFREMNSAVISDPGRKVRLIQRVFPPPCTNTSNATADDTSMNSM